ncbi:MAG: hypothetical protein Kow0010_09600 [Dehalococcoidia bacterium]
MASTPRPRVGFPLAGLAVGVVALAIVATAGPRASASELLQNGDFANWDGSGPEGWSVSPPGSAEQDMDCGCAKLTGSTTSLSQYVAANAGAAYSARVTVSPGSGLAQASLILTFLDAGLLALDNAISMAPAPGLATIEVEAVAPEGTVYAQFRVQLSGADGAVGFVSGASLVETAQATPTPTPTATATPAASATVSADTPEPSLSPGATATTTGTPTKTPTPTKTATPPRSPTATKTPKSPGGSTPPPGPGDGPLLDDGRGGLLLNGGFEHVRDNEPVGWSKYGGTLASAEFGAYEGSWAAALISTTPSTKWVHQVVPIAGGEWYRGTAVGKLTSGKGEVFLRMSWYASYDGSGTLIGQVDSNSTGGYVWTVLDTGPVQAPAGAKSVRFRLMIRPTEPATAMFDAAALVATEAPTPTPTPTVPPPETTPAAQSPGETPTVVPASPPQSAEGGTQQGAQPAVPARASSAVTLRISEVMAGPPEPGNDAAFEWVEIVNAGPEPVSTAGWRIGDAQTTDAIPEMTLGPGGYLVIAGPEAVFDEGVPVVRVADGRLGTGLNNTGDLVRLLAPDGTLIDGMSYGENSEVFDPPLPAAGPGETLGIRNPGGEGPANWTTMREPTPGGPNLFDEEPHATETPMAAAATLFVPSRTLGTSPTAGNSAPQRVIEEREGSMLPWLVLAAASGAGAVGATMAARRAAPRILERVRRRGGD